MVSIGIDCTTDKKKPSLGAFSVLYYSALDNVLCLLGCFHCMHAIGAEHNPLTIIGKIN